MSADFLDAIDWQQPWLKEVKCAAQPILGSADWRQALNDAASLRQLRNYRGLPVHFVPQEALPKGTAYEAFIGQTGAVPTRDNLHDFFNALVWLTFPRIKAGLNALQATAIECAADERPSGKRGQARDAATLFDESAALVMTYEPAMETELREHRWSEALWQRRDSFENGTCRVILFGHALMEKLTAPYKAITAHAWIVHAGDAPMSSASVDALVAEEIAGGLTTGMFTPLPVAGIPGWWPGQDEAFYLDASVFRPKRSER